MNDLFNNEETEGLKFDNEIKKLKLTMEYGSHFIEESGGELPPEIEAHWLEHIERFEEAYKKNNSAKIIFDYIGRPSFNPISEIKEDQVFDELSKILKLLLSNGIVVEKIYKVDPQEIYRFITEEIFFMKAEIFLEGMTQHIIYEEYYPNHKEDIKSHCMDFILNLLDKNRVLNLEFLPICSEFDFRTYTVLKEELEEKLNLFRDAFEIIKLYDFDIRMVFIEDGEAKVSFDLIYGIVFEGTNDANVISGSGFFISG